MNASQLGFARTVAAIAVFAGLNAVLTFLADASHLNALFGTGAATLIAALAGSLEQYLAAKGDTALFGAVKLR